MWKTAQYSVGLWDVFMVCIWTERFIVNRYPAWNMNASLVHEFVTFEHLHCNGGKTEIGGFWMGDEVDYIRYSDWNKATTTKKKTTKPKRINKMRSPTVSLCTFREIAPSHCKSNMHLAHKLWPVEIETHIFDTLFNISH